MQKCSCGVSSCHQQAASLWSQQEWGEAERRCQFDPLLGADFRRLMLAGVAIGAAVVGPWGVLYELIRWGSWALCGDVFGEKSRSLLIHYRRGRWRGPEVQAPMRWHSKSLSSLRREGGVRHQLNHAASILGSWTSEQSIKCHAESTRVHTSANIAQSIFGFYAKNVFCIKSKHTYWETIMLTWYWHTFWILILKCCRKNDRVLGCEDDAKSWTLQLSFEIIILF